MSDEMAMAAHAKMLDAEAERDELRDRLSRVEGALREIAGLDPNPVSYEVGWDMAQKARRIARRALPHPEDTGRCPTCEGRGVVENPESERVPDPNCARCGGSGEINDVDSYDPTGVYWCPRCCPRTKPCPDCQPPHGQAGS